MQVSGQLHDPAVLPPAKQPPPVTHLTGGWVGSRTDLDPVEKSLLNPGRPVRSLDIISTELSRILYKKRVEVLRIHLRFV
jgi:hypothetical protein